MWDFDYTESWARKNWCFWTMVLGKTLRVSWTARRSNQSILKEISPEYSLEGLMMKLKLQYFGYLMQRTDSLEKTLLLEKIEGRRRRGQQRIDGWMALLTLWTWVWVSSGSWWWTGKPGMQQSMGSKRVGHNWATELNWAKILSVWRQDYVSLNLDTLPNPLGKRPYSLVLAPSSIRTNQAKERTEVFCFLFFVNFIYLFIYFYL